LIVGGAAVARSVADRWGDGPMAIESGAGNRPQAWIPKEYERGDRFLPAYPVER
jgi:hypothetical protein